MNIKFIIWGVLYRQCVKRVLFLIDAERIHGMFVRFGEMLGAQVIGRSVVKVFFYKKPAPILLQNIAGVAFDSPMGLAAGFDYEARLAHIVPAIGFGWSTVGTVTNRPYDGNPPPRLGRLPKSQSLWVNKGFKNPGAAKVVEKLNNIPFDIPIGVSLGRTNSLMNQQESVQDIVSAFLIFENSPCRHAYYELNISCPNLFGDVNFYTPRNLEELLQALDKLKIKKPVFVKMPTSRSDDEVVKMLKIIEKFAFITGVIFGNLNKDRLNPALYPDEVQKFTEGSFSGKSVALRTNELIPLAYRTCGKRLIIIGCGGIFSAEDAYIKVRLGASLLQLITGMIFEGPQVISEIHLGLSAMLKKDGFQHISEAVGVDAKLGRDGGT